jgi:hypothetical protein
MQIEIGRNRVEFCLGMLCRRHRNSCDSLLRRWRSVLDTDCSVIIKDMANSRGH